MRAKPSSISDLPAFVLAVSLAACDGGAPPPSVSTSATTSAPSARGQAAPSGSPPVAKKELDSVGRIGVEAARAARSALAEVTRTGEPNGAAYALFRRAVARGEPFFRTRGFQAEALFGSGPADEGGGSLGRLDTALHDRDPKAIAAQAEEVSRALLLLEDSLSRSPLTPSALPNALSRAAFWLGAAIAGSKPGLSLSPRAAVADALGLLDAIRDGVLAAFPLVSPRLETATLIARYEERLQAVDSALRAAETTGELTERAQLIVTTGKLAAALGPVLSPFGAPWKPYSPRIASGGPPEEEPVTVLTVPVLAREKGRDPAEEDRLIALGEKLFSDKALSGPGSRSCATCHIPDKAYSDGRVTPESLEKDAPIPRNTPSLLYAPLHAAQFWDGRALTSERQAALVMHSKSEMAVPPSAFPRAGAQTEREAALALAAFQSKRLVPASSPLDRFARGEAGALSAEERAGFDVFAGKGRCARCHVPPLFGGAHPPDFATAVYSALGVPASPSGKALDADRGRAVVTRRELDTGAFKTPTVRNIAKTAPYFHHGAFPTLELVVDFYDKGGGKGLGLTVSNQDPLIVPLRLTAAEKGALLRFMRSALLDAAARK